MARTTRIAIIGGGIGGLTAAHALRRRGFEVPVYEAAPELKEIGAGVALGPNAMKALRSLELEDAVRAVAGRSDGQMLRNWKNGARDLADGSGEPGRALRRRGGTVHRADLLDVLAASLPSEIVTLGARCVGVEPDGDLAVARFENGAEIEADLDRRRRRDPLRRSGVAVRRRRTAVHRQDLLPQRDPGRRGPRRGPDPYNVIWMGPHGAIVVYRMRQDELINIVCHYDDATTATSRGSPSATVTRCSTATAAGTSPCFAPSRPGALVQVGALRPRPDPALDAGTRRRCWATPRIRCCPTSARERASRSRTGASSPPRSSPPPRIQRLRSRSTSARAGRARARSS